MNYDEYIADLLKPITAEKPCGDSVKDLTEYEALRAEIEKLGSIENRSIDWSLVVELGEKITREKGKDLSVIGFSTLGRLYTSGVTAYEAALSAIQALIDTQWESVQPERERSKLVALQWLVSESEKILGQAKIKTKDELDLIAVRWQSLDGVIRRRLQDKSPNSSGVFNVIERRKGEFREKTASVPAKSTVDVVKSITEIANENDLKLAIKQAQDQLNAISKYIREKSINDKKSYYFNRIAVAPSVMELPTSKDNVTGLLPPAPNQLVIFASLQKDGKHEALVKEIETNLRRYPWWMEGYRMQIESLTKLGPSFDEARQVVEVELRGFLNKNKKIFELRYANGEDIVTSDMKTWLDKHVLHEGKVKSNKEVAFEVEAHIEETLRRVEELVNDKQHSLGFDVLDEEISRQQRARNKLRLQLEKAKMLEQQDYLEVTVSTLEKLLESIENVAVSSWENELVEQILVMLLNNYEKAIDKNKTNAGRYAEKVRSCFSKLVECNVRTAMQFEQKESIRKIL